MITIVFLLPPFGRVGMGSLFYLDRIKSLAKDTDDGTL